MFGAFQILSKDNKVVLKTNWKLMDEEGFRFFGFITKKSFLSFELSNGEIVILPYNGSFEPKEYIKYGFTTFSAELYPKATFSATVINSDAENFLSIENNILYQLRSSKVNNQNFYSRIEALFPLLSNKLLLLERLLTIR